MHLAFDEGINLDTAGHFPLYLAKNVPVALQGTNSPNLTFLSLE